MAKNIPSHSISGVVRYKNGMPAIGLTVKVFLSINNQEPIKEAQTDDNGRFTFLELAFKKEDQPLIRVYEKGKNKYIHKEIVKFDEDKRSVPEIFLEKLPTVEVPEMIEPVPLPEAEEGPDIGAEEQKEKPLPAWNLRLNNIRMAIQPDKVLNAKLEAAFADAGGDWAKTREKLVENTDEATVSLAEKANMLADWLDDDTPVIEKVMADMSPDLNFYAFASQPGLRKKLEGIVADTVVDVAKKAGEPEKVQEEITGRADKLYNRLFLERPTAVLLGMASEKGALPIARRDAVAKTLEAWGADFDIKRHSVNDLLDTMPDDLHDDDKEEVKIELKKLQRITAISPTPGAIPILLKAGLHSAYAISDMPKSQFLAQFGEEMGRDVAGAVHDNAVKSRIRGEMAMVAYKEARKGSGVAAIETSSFAIKARGADEKPKINWDTLFDDADICECGECNSVYSPAAYFVELLQYLRNNNLDPEAKGMLAKKEDPGKISGTALSKLLERRPDLACLELTCKNAFTVLPYVDLVNEVMENYVVHQRPRAFNVEEDQTSAELLSQPFHTNYQAYCILSEAVFPFTLPYHQPIDASRIFLNFLGTSRHELLDTFRSACGPQHPETDRAKKMSALHDEKLQRAVDAEYLGLTEKEYIILTKEGFTSREYRELCKNKVYSETEYQQHIGVEPEHNYYGYDNSDNMLAGLTLVKDQFLRRTGIKYTDLVELLLTRCLNPHRPEGKAMAVTMAIPFSYRYLQRRFMEGGGGKHAMLKFLQENHAAIAGHAENLALECEAEHNNPERVIHPEDLKWWVDCYFEEIGNMIVLESENNPDESIFNKDNCDLNTIRLKHLNGDDLTVEEYGRIHRFIRLWRKLGWTIDEVDKAMAAGLDKLPQVRPETKKEEEGCCDNCREGRKEDCTKLDAAGKDMEKCPPLPKMDCRITPDLLHQLAAVKKLQSQTGMEVAKLLTFWTDISTAGDKSLYKRLFQTHNLTRLDPVFKADANGNVLLQDALINDHLPVLMAALNLTADDIESIVAHKQLDGKLTLSNVSMLYRYRLLSKQLGLRIPECIDAEHVFKNPFASPKGTLIFMENWEKMQGAGYDYRKLNYILHKKDDPKKPLEPSKITMLRLIKTLFDGLNDIESAHPDLTDTDRPDTEQLRAKATLLFDAALVEDIIAVVEGTTVYTAQAPNDLKEVTKKLDASKDAEGEEVSPVLSSLRRKVKYDAAGGNLTVAGLLSELEVIEMKKWSVDPLWVDTISILERKQKKWFDEIFKDLIDAEKAAPGADPAAILRRGDIVAPVPEPPANDPNTRLVKTRKFLEFYLPYLRRRLSQRLILDTLSGFARLDRGATDALVSTILQEGDKRLYEIFEAVKSFALPAGDTWTGYLIPPADADYRFFVADSSVKPVLNGLGAEFKKSADTPGVWETEPVPLKAGRRYRLTLQGLQPDKLEWKTAITKKELIPAAQWLPDNTWTGYLIPPADADYRFFVADSSVKPVVDGLGAEFTKQEDTQRGWETRPVSLKAGRLYRLTLKDVQPGKLEWKTTTTKKALIPAAQWLPDFTDMAVENALGALHRIALLVSGFNLSADELLYIHKRSADFGNLDFNALQLEHWFRLEAYTRLRNALPKTGTNLLEFFDWASGTPDPAGLAEKISQLTLWKKDRIKKLIHPDHFNLGYSANFRNEVQLLRMHKALAVADKIGMDINLLFNWAKPCQGFTSTLDTAESIRNTTRARYRQEDWEQVAKPLHDKLRANQRDALIAQILQDEDVIRWGVTDADGLFEYFLIDVQMEPCMETSRIKQAISSVQLFIHRCFLGLEEDKSQIAPSILDRQRWNWMQRYRVWEANRKVFLYPENWIEPNLRDDKSPFFKELESELLQKDINKQNVTDALKNYLYKVDEVANMEVVGLYVEKETYEGKEVEKLHVFSRTRNAPYFFYYRYLDIREGNWYPWEKMQVDIPSYDVEDANGQVTGNGCYLTPVVWKGRLLVFFPQFLKKTKPNENSAGKSVAQISQEPVDTLRPKEYWEIKLAWCEYRNGKWTQKQISSKGIQIDKVYGFRRDINSFLFFSKQDDKKVIIAIYDAVNDDKLSTGAFVFSGDSLYPFSGEDANIIPTKGITEDDPWFFFQQLIIFQGNYYSENNEVIVIPGYSRIQSMQISPESVNNNKEYRWDYFGEKVFYKYPERFSKSGIEAESNNFFYPHSSDLMGISNVGLPGSLIYHNFSLQDKEDVFGIFDSNNNGQIDDNDIYHELKRPYSLYNWELFFHTPAIIADTLSKAQQYEEARNWFHFVFNPLDPGSGQNKQYWKFLPFQELNSQRILESIFNQLQPNMADAKINAWRNNPFQPHLIARDRPVAYMKWVVMKYIDNLIAWGDQLFRQDTIETINEATQLYIMAGHILGPRPEFIPKRGKVQPQTYWSLLGKLDAFSNAMEELELQVPYSSQTSSPTSSINGETEYPNIFGFASTLYFCIPNNPKLMGYWDTVADRLFKIRHCQNIEGVFRKLALFEPPIDPGLLVRAAAMGLKISDVTNDLNTPMPNYRFYYLLQKSLELCNELKSLGGAMLSAIEKRDNETIALMRARHESSMQNLVMEVKKMQLEEANKSLETLWQNRKGPESRMKYYLQLLGEDLEKIPDFEEEFTEIDNQVLGPIDVFGLFQLNAFELADQISSITAFGLQTAATVVEGFAATSAMIPDVTVNINPGGVGISTMVGGGDKTSKAGISAAKILNFLASIAQFTGSESLKMNGYKRAVEERKFQANAAGYEIKQIDKQILAQQIRIDMANREISNQQQQIDNSREVEEFLRNKFSNEELYAWMRDSLKTLYKQVYNMAIDLAQKAEKVYRFERGLPKSDFLKGGYWDAGREGLLAGEQLYVGLKRLEAAYHENRGYDYEITRHISLRQLNPNALLQLRAKGSCEFELPEFLFDMDFPGHFRRRIKSLSMSIPCVAGPYTGINATLRLQEHKFRHTDIPAGYDNPSDDVFSTNRIPISSIALSSGQNDSGMFELNFKDERYLPFEGAGAISRWQLELSPIRQFDYQTITDVVVHLRYTAAEGGESLKLAARRAIAKKLKDLSEASQNDGLYLLLDLKNEFPNEWHKARNQESDFEAKIDFEKHFPYFTQSFEITPDNVNSLFVNEELNSVSGVIEKKDEEWMITLVSQNCKEPVYLVLRYGLKYKQQEGS